MCVCVACAPSPHPGHVVLISYFSLYTLSSLFFCSCVKMLNLWWVPLCSSTSDSWDREWTSLGWGGFIFHSCTDPYWCGEPRLPCDESSVGAHGLIVELISLLLAPLKPLNFLISSFLILVPWAPLFLMLTSGEVTQSLSYVQSQLVDCLCVFYWPVRITLSSVLCLRCSVYLQSFRVTAAVTTPNPTTSHNGTCQKHTSIQWVETHPPWVWCSVPPGFYLMWLLQAEMLLGRVAVVLLGACLDWLHLCFCCSPDVVHGGKVFIFAFLTATLHMSKNPFSIASVWKIRPQKFSNV